MQNMVTRLQGIMSQVLFEYALRISPKDYHAQDPGRTDPTNTKPKSHNVFGNINNLITTDLNALETGNRYLLLLYFMPVQIALSVTFLYSILGWSVFVGILAMIAMLSLPGFVTKQTHGVQVQRMRKSDARVQTITETLGGAIRMIKLFGWDAKSSAKIDEKRQEELKAIRKFKLLSLIATNIK
ncbi:hypothetical protein EIP86_003486 [Pleurotus ostreatoroseus]|nr:hypothetical protein EIP86_003486 [Pleurotus ostreatoroseus]